LWLKVFDVSEDEARTVALSTIVVAELLMAHASRSIYHTAVNLGAFRTCTSGQQRSPAWACWSWSSTSGRCRTHSTRRRLVGASGPAPSPLAAFSVIEAFSQSLAPPYRTVRPATRPRRDEHNAAGQAWRQTRRLT
jgi:hypothetical protein